MLTEMARFYIPLIDAFALVSASFTPESPHPSAPRPHPFSYSYTVGHGPLMRGTLALMGAMTPF